jgi:PKD repeat protein
VRGTVDLLATAGDNSELGKLEFFRGITLLGQGASTSDGYALGWDTSDTPDGTYTLKARATDTAGNQTTSKYEVTVDNSSASPPASKSSFTLAPTGGTAPVKVSFTDTSVNQPARWLWDFGDGKTSRRQHPTHVYPAPGTYSVTLTASNGPGVSTSNRSITVGAFPRAGRVPGATRVLLVGDSITVNYCTILARKLRNDGYSVQVMGQGGKGLLSDDPQQLPKLQGFVSSFDPDKTVLEYIGNYRQDESTSPGVLPESPEFLDLWQARAYEATQRAGSRGGRVWWIDHPFIAPYFSQGPSSDEVRTGYHVLHASIPQTGYIDAFWPFGGPALDESLRSDGLHLNAAGMDLMSSLVRTAITDRNPDHSPPSPPSLSASIVSGAVELDWTRATDTGASGLVGYGILRGAQAIAHSYDPTALTFTDTTVQPGRSYTYRVTAYDGAGNAATGNAFTINVPG